MCTGKRSPEVYVVAHIDRYALPHRVQKTNALTLIICKKYALTRHIWKAKYHGTRRVEGIWPSTRRPESTSSGVHRPDATCLDSHRLQEICLDTLCLERKMLGCMLSRGICPHTCRPKAKCCGVHCREEIRPYTGCLKDKIPRHSSSRRHILWHSLSEKYLLWLASSGYHIC